MAFRKRILKESQALSREAHAGIEFIPTDEITHWFVNITANDNQLYTGKLFNLEIIIGDDYPIGPPRVQFVQDQNVVPRVEVPVHPHIYSNGHICLDILGDGWTPVQNIQSVAISIHSMLVSNTRNGKLFFRLLFYRLFRVLTNNL